MTLLAVFSVWSWAIFFRKLFQFSGIKGRCNHFLSAYRFQQSVREWRNLGPLLNDNPYGRILASGVEEYAKLKTMTVRTAQQSPDRPETKYLDELSDNIRLAMEKTRIGEIAALETALPTLSTFVSVSPFLGLLGTVWGIMEAFLDIRARGSAHITIVAPGISDALITTVYGLLVAIPALIFFNIFRARVNSLETELNTFINEVFAKLRKELLRNEN